MYGDINNGRQDLTLKLLSAIDNIKSARLAASNTIIPIITYHSKKRLISLKNWEDPSDFPATFPTLFLFGDSRYLRNRQQPVLIEA